MDDDERVRIARQGLDVIERLEQVDPEALRARVDQTARRAAGDAVLGGIGAIARLTGTAPRRPRTGPSAETVERTLAAMEARGVAAFDQQLADAVQRAREGARDAAAPDDPVPSLDTAELRELARLRRSFPAEARELAILVFACADLLEDLAERDHPPPADELARKEVLIARIGALLAPRAGEALGSFVGHVAELSRRHRAAR